MKSTHRPFARTERIGDEMRCILANMFISDIHIPGAGLLTVTNVKVTDDLRIAKIYISFLENKKSINELLQILIAKKNIIRHNVGLKLELKYIPELRFYYDNTTEHAEIIDKLINKIHLND